MQGWSLGEISIEINASSKGQVSVWVRDVALTDEVKQILKDKNPANGGMGSIGNPQKCSETWRKKRRQYQQEGKEAQTWQTSV